MQNRQFHSSLSNQSSTTSNYFANIFGITVLLTIGFYLYYSHLNISLISAAAVPITIFFLFLFVAKLGVGFPVKEVMVLLTAIQFLYSPFLAYFFYEPDPIYPMEVSADIYFQYAVPAVLFFAAGLYLFPQHTNLIVTLPQRLKEYNIGLVGKRLIVIGLIADFTIPFVPASLRFFLLLLSYFKFVGAYYLFFSEEPHKKWWYFAVFTPLVLYNIAQGMFHELLLWGLFSMMVYYIGIGSGNILKKVIFISFCFVSVFYLNVVKKEYRDLTWKSTVHYSTLDRLNLFGQSLLKVVSGNPTAEGSSLKYSRTDEEQNLARLNQGVIVSRIMNHTGIKEPFADGETVEAAIEAALVPRMLNPNKARSGGYDTYERFTGYGLGRNTSISLSLLGEGYANYGQGGILFMGFLGLFYGFVLSRITKLSQSYPYLILWIPFLFLTVIKAEEGLETVVNYLTKSTFVLWIVFKFYLKPYTFFFPNTPEEPEEYIDNNVSTVTIV